MASSPPSPSARTSKLLLYPGLILLVHAYVQPASSSYLLPLPSFPLSSPCAALLTATTAATPPTSTPSSRHPPLPPQRHPTPFNSRSTYPSKPSSPSSSFVSVSSSEQKNYSPSVGASGPGSWKRSLVSREAEVEGDRLGRWRRGLGLWTLGYVSPHLLLAFRFGQERFLLLDISSLWGCGTV